MNSEKHIVPPLSEKQRLSDYAVGIFQVITSRKGIKKAIKKGSITLNGKVGQTGDYLTGGEVIILTIQEKIKPVLELELQVLFEDDHLAIIDKPAGIAVSGNKAHTIENALSFNLQKSPLSDALHHPAPIHRLDHPTSGVLLIGKTRSITIALNQIFESRAILKTYHAISIGNIPHNDIIKTLIDGKSSITTYKIIKTIPSERFGQLNLVELHPETGRRHQIRKHLTAIGSPILGDPLYSKDGLYLKGKGLYLHASELEFAHPISGISVKVQSELPKKFKTILS